MPPPPAGMLEIPLTELGAAERPECRHEHAVVIDQPQVRASLDDDVRRLDVTVRNSVLAQVPGQPAQREPHLLQRAGVLQVLGDECGEALPVHPVHPHDRIGAALRGDPLRLELAGDQIGALDAGEVLRDRVVALVQRVEPLVEAA